MREPRSPCYCPGGVGYTFQLIAEVPSFMSAIHVLLQRTPMLFNVCKPGVSRMFHWARGLADNSRDRYNGGGKGPPPPFSLRFVKAGLRRGWSWCAYKAELKTEFIRVRSTGLIRSQALGAEITHLIKRTCIGSELKTTLTSTEAIIIISHPLRISTVV